MSAMKLYFFPGACSQAPHIALLEAGLPFSLVRYDRDRHVLETGAALETVNPKGVVPVLELDDGQRLTEVPAVLQYIADLVPERGLAPPAGTMPRYRLMEWLNFLGTEVHKPYWPLFHDGAEIENTKAREKLGHSFSWVQEQLGERPFLPLGPGEPRFSVADAYLFVVLGWTKPAGLDLTRWPQLAEYRKRLRERPAVAAALDAERAAARRA
jgi:glutathione S-transferase